MRIESQCLCGTSFIAGTAFIGLANFLFTTIKGRILLLVRWERIYTPQVLKYIELFYPKPLKGLKTWTMQKVPFRGFRGGFGN
jgi:hypothetical protein